MLLLMLFCVLGGVTARENFCGAKIVNGKLEKVGNCEGAPSVAKIHNQLRRGPGWHLAKNGYLYRIIKEKKTYSESEKYCDEFGGRLASAGLRDNDVRRELEVMYTPGTYVWVGLDDRKTEGEFIWSDGTKYTNVSGLWRPGEPNDANGNEDCAALDGIFPLNDVPCDRMYYLLCEVF